MATLHVRRIKQGTPSTHPILGDELRALGRLHREQEPKSPFVFTSERGAPFTTAGFARMIERAGRVAKLSFKAHPHMLRHACGYALANRGHDTRALQARAADDLRCSNGNPGVGLTPASCRAAAARRHVFRQPRPICDIAILKARPPTSTAQLSVGDRSICNICCI
jgi:hypothetical protein